MQDLEGKLQWHPAFYAGLQIELEHETEKLSFENEHQLGTKPKEIDVLIIKKENNYHVKKNIGRIFRKHNIIEYKSPSDYLGIDDFYRVYGYTCFYKSDAVFENSIPVKELTITFICSHCPRKLIRHLMQIEHYTVCEIEQGIFHIKGDRFPIQIIITSRLSKEENFWLKSLTDQLKSASDAKDLLYEYQKHKTNTLYQSVMDVIIRANKEKFQEGKEMCEALMELMKDEFEEAEKKGILQGFSQGRTQGRTEGKIEGKMEGQKLSIITLIQCKLKKGKSLEAAASELEQEPEDIRDIYEMTKAHPAANSEDIYHYLYPAS